MDFRTIKPRPMTMEAIEEAYLKGEITRGPYVEKVEDKIKEVTGMRHAVAVSSGTMALTLALDALGVKQGDYVVVPDLTFIACATAVMTLGAVPYAVDVDRETYTIDWFSAAEAIGKHGDKVKAVMPVSLGGRPVSVPSNCKVPVLMDCAHYIGVVHHDTIFSFHPSKVISGFGGGCYVTDDKQKADRVRRMAYFNLNENRLLYDRNLGYNGYMTNIQAIPVWYELEQWKTIVGNRQEIAWYFDQEVPWNNREAYGMYLVEVDDPAEKRLEAEGFIRHWPKTISQMIGMGMETPNAQDIVKYLVSAPFHEHMSVQDRNRVVALLKERIRKL